ncbi:fasciclin domain-containing protein [Sphingopyxis sp. DHUNG17]|uniref:fasciclin domain-containing protein n=1 Tax=Sphingopyxis jiangsuensis TaxID=2871171 RepID=UPI00191DA826|nr:fasciclin domain-containing protein [Sphingopyxis lutea]MBL0767391.1 fasciclin domain-containing protein [Sphingopyxis lutea]
MTNCNMLVALAAASICLAGCSDKPASGESDPVTSESLNVGVDKSVVDSGKMAASNSIAENIAGSPNHKMLHGTLQAAGLVERLGGDGEYTVFAPTDAAFVQIPPVTREGWMLPAQKQVLHAILNHHVVRGRIDSAELERLVDAGDGAAKLKTLDGRDLWIRRSGASYILTSGSGNKAAITEADLAQKNGVVHIVDAVLIPAT